MAVAIQPISIIIGIYREEVLLNLVYAKAFTIGWDAHINPKVDFNLHQNEDRIYKYK